MENPVVIPRVDSDASISNFDAQPVPGGGWLSIRRAGIWHSPDFYLAPVRSKLDGVAQEVVKDLLELGFVGEKRRKLRLDVE